jgi:F-type H+-transporting ATPase subunit a
VRSPKVWIIVVVVLAAIVAGFIIAKSPQPEISLSADPIFNIPFGIFTLHVTNTLITAYTVTIILALCAWLATRKASIVPSGFYNFVEAIVEWLLSFTEEIAGAKNGRKFFSFVATIFLFVIACNYFGLLPIVNSFGVVHRDQNQNYGVTMNKAGPVWLSGINPKQYKKDEALADPAKGAPDAIQKTDSKGVFTLRPLFRSVNSDANSPLAIAFWSFFFVELWGLQALGFRYLGKFFAIPPFTKKFSPINVFVGGLEFLSELIRIISFTFRLFGNIFAGDVLILFMSFLVPFVLPVVFYGLETFVGFIQAAVFALLTLVFAVMAVESHDESEHEAHEAHGVAAEAATH